MLIKPTTALRTELGEITRFCKDKLEPVFLTKNGEGDLVVMDIETFTRRESMLKLREQLVASEEDRQAGNPGSSIEDVVSMMRNVINEVKNG